MAHGDPYDGIGPTTWLSRGTVGCIQKGPIAARSDVSIQTLSTCRVDKGSGQLPSEAG